MHADSLQKMNMDSCMRAYSTVQQLLCHGGYCELILSLARTSCRLLFTAHPTARPLAGNLLRDAVRSRNPSRSSLTHDAVATAVLHKHHPIISVGAGLIQFVYRSHLRLATEATRNRNAFSPFFARVSLRASCNKRSFSLSYTHTFEQVWLCGVEKYFADFKLRGKVPHYLVRQTGLSVQTQKQAAYCHRLPSQPCFDENLLMYFSFLWGEGFSGVEERGYWRG